MRGWMLAGLHRHPGPMIGTLAAAATAAALSIAAFGVAGAHSPLPLGRLAGADVVVAADPQLQVTIGTGHSATTQTAPLQAYRGVPARLASQLARVPGVAETAVETGFPDGTVQPGLVDLIAVRADQGVSAGTLAQRIKAALHGAAGYTIATGTARAGLANPGLAVEIANGHALGDVVIPLLIITALFALATTTALSVDLRRRRFALLRAIGATRGQVRRAVLAEQALLAVAGGLLGYVPGTTAGALAVRALVAHGMLPAGSSAASSPWFAVLACVITLPVCVLSALLAARRAARTSPARAVRETHADRTRPHPVRVLLGLAAGTGVVALSVLALHHSGPGAEAAMALPLLMAGMVAVALLGPVLVTAAAAVLRPLAGTGPAARLALAGIRSLPRRTASAVIPVAMAVGMTGAIAFFNTSEAHAASLQSAQAVTASYVLAGSGLDDRLLTQARDLPGVRAAVGITALDIGVTDPNLELLGGEAVSAAAISQVLSLGVASGSLAGLKPGQIAISTMEASDGEMGVHVGARITVYLPDGTQYRATVSAIYRRSLALGDLLIPAAVTDGHTGAPAGYGQILISGGSQRELAALAAAHPGVRLASRAVYNAKVAQNSFGDNVILGVIAALAAVTMINTLAVSTAERRRQVLLLARIGATARQLAAAFGWQALFVTVTGIAAGAAVCAGTLIGLDRAVTGTAVPYIPATPAALIVAAVAALAFGTIMTTFTAISHRTENVKVTASWPPVTRARPPAIWATRIKTRVPPT
jgi:putative ABC transport system permease protein